MLLDVVRLMPRAVPLVAILALLPLHIGAMCEGWQSTAEARMACCAPGGECDMHGVEPEGSGAALTQAQADQCCALSTSDESRVPEPAASVPTTSPARIDRIHAVVRPVSRPLLAIGRMGTRPPGHVPKHVLLSVFLL